MSMLMELWADTVSTYSEPARTIWRSASHYHRSLLHAAKEAIDAA